MFRKTSTISTQVFPFTLDIDSPRWIPALERMNAAFLAMDEARRRGGIAGRIGRLIAGAKGALAFVSLYTIPAVPNEVPVNPRLEPAY